MDYKVVEDIRTLRAMERRGLVEFHTHTGRMISGLYSDSDKKFKCYYVDSGRAFFEYKGRKYATKFFDGCFCPYVVEILE